MAVTQKSLKKTFKISQDMVSKMFWTVVGSMAAIVVMAIIWRIGADFTVMALRWLARGFDINQQDGTWYFIPVLFSIVELTTWKLKKELSQRVRNLGIIMTALDAATTMLGVYLAIINVYIPLLKVAEITTPMRAGAVVAAGLAGWLVTLYPERIVLDSLLQIWQVVQAIKKIFEVKANPQEAQNAGDAK